MTKSARQRLVYVIGDYLSSVIAVFIFNLCRYHFNPAVHSSFVNLETFIADDSVVAGQILFPLMMMGIYYLSGYYNHPFFTSRLRDFLSTASSVTIAAAIILFATLLNDMNIDRIFNYELIALLLFSLFLPVYAVRFFITRHATHKIHSRQWQFPSLIIGTTRSSIKLHKRLDTIQYARGFDIVGHVATSAKANIAGFPYKVYDISDIETICRELKITSLIIDPTNLSNQQLLEIINRLLSLDMPIYLNPDSLRLLTSHVITSNIAGEPLIDISRAWMSPSTQNIKRVSDVVISAVTLIAISPLLALLAIAIKIDSRGPVFYLQQRIGYHQRRFNIIKLRSMYTDAEASGPMLSRRHDNRITRVGRFLRKYRLDELPQFFNVLRGDMSIVGPRPEREYYIKEILKRAPYYTLIHRVRPGITSWGMVKFGYATTIDQMRERLRYDLVYIENVSFLVDLKIIIYTIRTVVTGKGI